VPKETQIYVRCGTHPNLFKPRRFQISHKHEYTPPSIEAGILQNVKKSSTLLLKQWKSTSQSGELKRRIGTFVGLRGDFLTALTEVPEVKTFINYVLFLESEVEKEIELLEKEREVEEILTGEKIVDELSEEEEAVEEIIETPEKEYDNLLDALSDAINKEKETGESKLETMVKEYVANHLRLLNWLLGQSLNLRELGIDQSEYQELLANLITVDTVLIANSKEDLGTKKSILIPLDVSPLRIPLVMLSTNINWNRISYPPLLLLWKENISQLVKPYRTLDGHPMMVYVPEFRRDAERAQEEIRRALDNFRENIEPLIRNVKGLTPMGKRDTSPIFIRKPLATILSVYLCYNPMSIDNLKVMDLGCGSGALLKDIYLKLIDKEELRSQLFIQTLLNDITENPGNTLIKESQRENFLNKLELYVWRGDMRSLIEKAFQEAESFDVAFVNRVFDLYGGYGIFRFYKEKSPRNDLQTTVELHETTSLDHPEKLTAFSGALAHEEVWRSIKYLLGQRIETAPHLAFLPAIEMNMLKNFFAWKGKDGLDLFQKLLSVARLVVVSVFPGSFETIFPKVDEKDKIFHFEMSESQRTYSIICISKDKLLIDFLQKNVRE